MQKRAGQVDPVLLRTARVAKTAARAGRFLKITKVLEIIVTRRAPPPGPPRSEHTVPPRSHRVRRQACGTPKV